MCSVHAMADKPCFCSDGPPKFTPRLLGKNRRLWQYSGTSLIRTNWDQSFCPLYRGVRYSGGTKVTCILISLQYGWFCVADGLWLQQNAFFAERTSFRTHMTTEE